MLWEACIAMNCKWSLGHIAARKWALLATNKLGRDPQTSHAITALANTLISALWIIRLWAETQLGHAQIEDINLGIDIDIDLHNHRVSWQLKNSGRIFYAAFIRQNYAFSEKLQFLLLKLSIDWMRPTHKIECNLLYLKLTNGVNHIYKIPVQEHLS